MDIELSGLISTHGCADPVNLSGFSLLHVEKVLRSKEELAASCVAGEILEVDF